MNARPKRYLGGGLRTVIGAPRAGIWVECSVTTPPSREGQTIYVFFDEDDSLAMFNELREQQARARR